jgi:oligopeptide transport system substrate-binding protein
MISGYTPQEYTWKSMAPEARLDRAHALVEAAGFGPDHPLSLTIIYTTSPSSRRRLEAIKTMLRAIDVDVTLENLEWRAFLERTEQHDYDLAWCGLSHFYDDYGVKLSDFVSDAGERNLPGYRNPAFDALVRDGDLADDIKTRRRLMEQAEAVLLADYPLIPIAQRVVNRLVTPALRGGADRVENPQSRYLWFDD